MEQAIPTIPSLTRSTTVAQALVESIANVYSKTIGKQRGLYYWPDTLPTPSQFLTPDPLVLCPPEQTAGTQLDEERVYVIEHPLHMALQLRNRLTQSPFMIPLGLVDIPEAQSQQPLALDMHGLGGPLTGGPVVIAGMQNSGKATALQTILLWLATRYSSRHLRCAIIDPMHDLEQFRTLPHVRDQQGQELWIEGDTNEQIKSLAEYCDQLLAQRHRDFPNQRWNATTVPQLQEQGASIPFFLVIISNFHMFAERSETSRILKELALRLIRERALGVGLILSSEEVGSRYIPGDLMAKIGIKIGLFLNEQARSDVFGRVAVVPEPVPGRGLIMTRDRMTHEIQIALPVAGATEGERFHALQCEIDWLASQGE